MVSRMVRRRKGDGTDAAEEMRNAASTVAEIENDALRLSHQRPIRFCRC